MSLADLAVVLILVQIWFQVSEWLTRLSNEELCEVRSQETINQVASLLFESDAGPGLAIVSVDEAMLPWEGCAQEDRQPVTLLRFNSRFIDVLESSACHQDSSEDARLDMQGSTREALTDVLMSAHVLLEGETAALRIGEPKSFKELFAEKVMAHSATSRTEETKLLFNGALIRKGRGAGSLTSTTEN